MRQNDDEYEDRKQLSVDAAALSFLGIVILLVLGVVGYAMMVLGWQ